MKQISNLAKRYLRDFAIASMNVSTELSFNKKSSRWILQTGFGCLIKKLTHFAKRQHREREVLYYRNISPKVFRGLKVLYFVLVLRIWNRTWQKIRRVKSLLTSGSATSCKFARKDHTPETCELVVSSVLCGCRQYYLRFLTYFGVIKGFWWIFLLASI